LCKKEFNGRYIKLECGDVVCDVCSDSHLKEKEKICKLCKKEIVEINELNIKNN
jgi:hypothetical protein